MKIKDTLDLCGWELWNFCIQNHQNLEGLLDLGAGRKVFYTGNDQGKNGREVIYDGSKWKVSAYMSDVDELRGLITALENATDEEIEALKGRATSLEGRATTTEGNLATLRSEFDALNKSLNDDTAGTIDTWNEIQNFVGKYDGSEDLETILSRMNAEIDTKFDKAGGTINGNLQIGTNDNTQFNHLTIVRSGKAIRLNGYGTGMGLSFGSFSSGGTFTQEYQIAMSDYGLQYKESDKTYNILHEGNYSDLITTINNSLSVGGNILLASDVTALSDLQLISRGSYIGLRINDVVKMSVYSTGIYSDVLHTFQAGALIPTGQTLTIGEATISWDEENNALKVNKSIYSDGEVSAGGAATEGNGGAGGFSLYESWGTSAPTEPLALGANLGYELKTRVEDLELAKTKVEISDTLVSGKPIGAITIDGNKTNLFAPATYAWSEITGTENVLTTAGGTIGNRLTISSESDAKIIFNETGTDAKYQQIAFQDNGVEYGRLGTYGDDQLKWTGKTILHEGNVGEYNAGSADVIAKTYVENINYNDKKSALKLIQTTGGGDSGVANGFPTNCCSGLSVMTDYTGWQMVSYGGDRANPWFRKLQDNGTWSDWKTIAFTDSDITGNAATATKLATPRTIWGQSFDGTGNVSGDITMNNYSAIKFKNAAGTSALNAMMVDSSNQLTIGYDQSANSLPTRIDGASVYLRHGTAHTNGLILNSSGNVSIGIQDYAETNYKFFVSGSQFLACSDDASVALNGLPTNGFAMGYKGSRGLYMWLSGAGAASIQVKRFDTQSEAYALNLNPLGGAVNIASANANTNVLGHLFASKDLYMSGFLMMNRGGEGIYIAGASLNWHNTNNAWSASLLSFAKDSFTIHPTLYANGLANFSSRVLIGGADDNGEKLQVDGFMTAKGSISKDADGKGAYFGAAQFGLGSNYKGALMYAYGDDTNLYFYSNGIRMLINSSGNVTIGASDLAGSDYKLVVNGLSKFKNNVESEGNIIGAGAVQATTSAHGFVSLQVGSTGNKGLLDSRTGWFIYTDGTNTFLPRGNVGIGTTNPQAKLDVNGEASVSSLAVTGTSTFGGQSTFNALALFNEKIVAKNTLKIGDANIWWDEEKKALFVDKSLASMGEISAGGAGTEGGNTGSGGTGTITNPYVVNFTPSNETSHSFYHNLPYYDVVVQVYEKNAISGAWDMILADVTIANESRLVTVDFGRKENVEHKIVVR